MRLFQTHKIRRQHELEGLWDFMPVKLGESIPKEYNYFVPVPGCWEQHSDFLTYRGCAVYRTKITAYNDGSLRLEFKGVSHTADICFNSKLILLYKLRRLLYAM